MKNLRRESFRTDLDYLDAVQDYFRAREESASGVVDHIPHKRKTAGDVKIAVETFAEYLNYDGDDIKITINEKLKIERKSYINAGDFFVYYDNKKVFDACIYTDCSQIDFNVYIPGEWEEMLERAVKYIEEQIKGKQKKI